MTIPYKSSVIYGPISSRRLGRSLGLNLLPLNDKVCSFDCIYCQYGRTRSLTGEFLKGDEILVEIERALRANHELDHITFSGNGEPMLHPEFARIVAGTRKLRDAIHPHVPIAILTNGTEFSNDEKREALKLIDKVIVKIDCGDEESFRRINRPLRTTTFKEHLAVIQSGGPNYIQTLFFRESLKYLDQWYRVIETFGKVCEVQLYTLDRPTEHDLIPLTIEELKEIANRRLRVRINCYHRGV
ncbi:hypothetical protein DRP53_00860 [candidate division WOR-3 bacterium]|mgnify:CR=1 FL=1|uniref:Radical SAM core domain-containing protein n=1 Tax=candidate division WOR-3 bacterium TaxID=2052148 RepID=A0A660SLI9_UNCW3|nr:MAG: hypothetical protein DRP53_00860 [candidate division WOR-3 bacterium]